MRLKSLQILMLQQKKQFGLTRNRFKMKNQKIKRMKPTDKKAWLILKTRYHSQFCVKTLFINLTILC